RPTIAALYAIEIINDLKNLLYKNDLSDHVSKLDKEIRNFEKIGHIHIEQNLRYKSTNCL
ncbi:hypothetical protein Bpfe_011918, partial [Biomphalaria pfeifferi]